MKWPSTIFIVSTVIVVQTIALGVLGFTSKKLATSQAVMALQLRKHVPPGGRLWSGPCCQRIHTLRAGMQQNDMMAIPPQADPITPPPSVPRQATPFPTTIVSILDLGRPIQTQRTMGGSSLVVKVKQSKKAQNGRTRIFQDRSRHLLIL